MNNPVLKEQGDITLTAAIKPSLSGPADSMHNNSIVSPAFDAAFAVSDHVGIIGSYRSTIGKEIQEDGISSIGGVYNGHRFELGGGYFTTLGKKGRFEIYGGGAGQMKRTSKTAPDYNFDTKYIRAFIQSAIGFSSRDVVSLSGGLRFAMMKYNEFNVVDPDLKYIIIDQNLRGTADVTNLAQYYVEPFINFEVGYQFIKFNAQLGTSFPLTDASTAAVGGVLPYFSLGVTFSYAQRYLKK